MSNILGILGLTTSTGTEKLITAFGNDYHIWNATLNNWVGQSIPTTANINVEGAVFLDKAFFVNGNNDDVKRYTGSIWSNETATRKAPRAKYIKQVKDRIYLANLSYNGNNYPSRFWFTDLPQNNDVTYGLEYGTDLSQTAGSPLITSASAYFKTRNIKVGDPIVILNGSNLGQYNVSSVDNENRIILTTNLVNTATGSSYWVGSNYVDVSTNDNDVLTGISDNNNLILAFKRDSLWRYDGRSLVKVKGVPGTISSRSIVNIRENTYYFHRTGIWRCNGITSELLSRPLQDYIEGISPDMYPSIVGWKTGPSLDTYRLFVGNVSNPETGVSVSKCFIDFDTVTENLSPGQLQVNVKASTEFVESNTRNIYIGTDTDRVYQDSKGNSDDGLPISWMMDTGFHFPAGPRNEIEFEKIQFHVRNGRGMQIRYKLYGTPFSVDKQWRGLDDASDEVTEILMSPKVEKDNVGRGIAFEMTHSGIEKPPVVERIDVFWKPITSRSL